MKTSEFTVRFDLRMAERAWSLSGFADIVVRRVNRTSPTVLDAAENLLIHSKFDMPTFMAMTLQTEKIVADEHVAGMPRPRRPSNRSIFTGHSKNRYHPPEVQDLFEAPYIPMLMTTAEFGRFAVDETEKSAR